MSHDAGQRHVDKVPPTQAIGGQRRHGRVETRQRVRDGVATEAGRARRTRRGTESGGRRRVVAKGHPLGARLRAAVSAETDPGEPRPLADSGLGIDSELAQRPRTRALDHHVRAGEQVPELAGLQHGAFLVPVQQGEEVRVAAPRPVRTRRALDLQHPRAGEPEQMRAQRPGPERGKIDHEGTRLRVAPESPAANGYAAPRLRPGGHRRRGRDRHAEKPSAPDQFRDRPRRSAGFDEVPELPLRRLAEPGGQAGHVVRAGEIDGDPAVGTAHEPTAPARRNPPTPPVAEAGSALA